MRSQTPKILIITDGYPTSKNLIYGLYVKEQTDELKKQVPDWHIDIYYNPFFKIFSNPLKKRSSFWNIIKWILQLICFIPLIFKKYDIVHAHRFFLPVFNGALYKAFHPKVALIVTSHGIVQVRKRYNTKWTKKLFHFLNLIIAVNSEMKNEFIHHFGLDPSKVVIRSCGIDIKEIDHILKRTNITELHDNKLNLGFVSVFKESKKPDFYIKTIEYLYKKYPVKGVMIGGGENFKKYNDYVIKHHLPIEVYDTLPHKEIIPYYKSMDLFLFPSNVETFGIVGIEALYCGVPVIASSIGGKKDYIQVEKNGYLFENNDLHDMIKKTEKLVADRALLKMLSLNASKSVLSYNREEVVKEIITYYKQYLDV